MHGAGGAGVLAGGTEAGGACVAERARPASVRVAGAVARDTGRAGTVNGAGGAQIVAVSTKATCAKALRSFDSTTQLGVCGKRYLLLLKQ